MTISAAVLMIVLWLLACIAAAYANGPQLFTQTNVNIIGAGCGTVFYLDRMCKPCGVGMRADGIYPTTAYPLGTYPSPYTPANPPPSGTAAWYTVGNVPDADPLDPLVCTTAQWEAKWGWTGASDAVDNAAMATFLFAEKHYVNNSWGCSGTGVSATCTSPSIYYLSQSGNDSTGAVNSPSHPYLTTLPILNLLQTTVTSFSGTGSITSGSNLLTITSVTSGSLAYNMEVTGTGLPGGDYFILGQQSGTAGGAGVYYMQANATSTHAGEAIAGSHFPGGAVVVESGAWSQCSPYSGSGPCWRITGCWTGYLTGGCPSYTGSEGYPIYMLAFPGETAELQTETDLGFGSTAYDPPICCMVFDNLEWLDPTFDVGTQGNALCFTNATDITIINNEFVGWDKICFANHSQRIIVTNNVFHEEFAHDVYFEYTATDGCIDAGASSIGPGDVNFAAYEASYLSRGTIGVPYNGGSGGCGAAYSPQITNNVIYDTSYEGYDPIHMNSHILGGEISGNIISYVGGAPFGFQTGDYGVNVAGNIAFDHADNCWIPYLEPLITPNSPATLKWNSFINNICWESQPTDVIWGSDVWGGVEQTSSQTTLPEATFTSGSNIVDITAGGGSVGYYEVISGTSAVPTGTALVGPGICTSSTTPSCTGTGGNNGTYMMTNAATASTSANVTLSNPPLMVIEGTTFKGNIISQFNNSNSNTSTMPFQFYWQTYPESNTITDNILWSNGTVDNPSTAGVMFVLSGAGSGPIPAGTYVFSGGTGCNPSAGSFSNCFPGNSYTNPNFPSASESLLLTPGLFNFGTPKAGVNNGLGNLN